MLILSDYFVGCRSFLDFSALAVHTADRYFCSICDGVDLVTQFRYYPKGTTVDFFDHFHKDSSSLKKLYSEYIYTSGKRKNLQISKND